MTFLLDTDTVILLMQGLAITRPSNERQQERQATGLRILSKCRQASQQNHRVALSAITVAELEYGICCAASKEKERERMATVLRPFALLDFTAGPPAKCYGDIRHLLSASGRTIGPNDLLIAAHALSLSAVLVSNNLREFQRVPGLKCESWAVA